jgi:hypothetical protein
MTANHPIPVTPFEPGQNGSKRPIADMEVRWNNTFERGGCVDWESQFQRWAKAEDE